MTMVVSSYLGDCFDVEKLRGYARKIAKALRPHAANFDAIAFRGMSGALVAPIVGHIMKKQLLLIRKPYHEESAHTSRVVEGNIEVQSYVIVDDMMSSGNTVQTIADDIRNWQIGTENYFLAPPAICYGGAFYMCTHKSNFMEESAQMFRNAVKNQKAIYFPCREKPFQLLPTE
jgi:hypoxanthine phosphoribosyltransferase